MNTGLESLLWYGLIAVVFFLMMRGGCGAHVMGHGHHHHGDELYAPPDGGSVRLPSGMASDPVCGVQVDPASAKSSVYRGRLFFFCSPEHRDAFEAQPERYVHGSVPATSEESHSHG